MKKLVATLYVILLSACAPLSEITSIGNYQVSEQDLQYESFPQMELDYKTNVVFVTSQKGTEIFDLLAPYEIFSRSGNYRLIIAAPEKAAVPLWKGVGIVPHATFDELDNITDFNADVIVIPNIIDDDNARVLQWVKENVDQADYVLSVCEGARVIGNSGVFKRSVVTSFSATVDELKKKYEDYQWIKDRRYVKSGRLISTAGVSASVEGALALVAQMHGDAHADIIRQDIGYRFPLDDASYTPQSHGFNDLWRIFKKITFNDNQHLGFLLRPGVSEMKLAAVIDTYARTLPASLVSVTENNKPIISRHGLKFVPKITLDELKVDQLHILGGAKGQILPDSIKQKTNEIYRYEAYDSYALAQVLAELKKQYNSEFVEVVAKLLNYPADRL